MTAIAQSAYLRDDLDAALLWSDRALALADEFDLPAVRLAALVEKGSTLTERPHTAAAGRKSCPASSTRPRRRASGCWPPGPSTSWCTASRRPRRPSTPRPWNGCGSTPSGPASSPLAVATYFQGRARLAMRAGDLRAAIAALEEGREQDRSYRRRGRWADYHGVFLAGLYLEAGELDRVEQLIADLAALPNNPPTTIPGLAFHLACRRGDLPRAEATLDELFTRPGRADVAQRRAGPRPDLRRARGRPARTPARPDGRRAARRRRVGRLPDAGRGPARRRRTAGTPRRWPATCPSSRRTSWARRPAAPYASAPPAACSPRTGASEATAQVGGGRAAAGRVARLAGGPARPGPRPARAWPRPTRHPRSPARPR